MSTVESKDQLSLRMSSILPSLGMATGLGAIVSKACCVLPLAMAGAGMGATSFTVVQALMPLRVPLLVMSALLIAAGWLSYARDVKSRSEADCDCAPTGALRRNAVVLSVATLLLATAIAWNVIQPTVMQMAT